MSEERVDCPICRNVTVPAGTNKGTLDGRTFVYRYCESCEFVFVENNRSDFENLYDESYYKGQGADPTINYVNDFSNSKKTIRNYEYAGLTEIFLQHNRKDGKWLDYGCGAGGLVRYAQRIGLDASGYDEGWAASVGKDAGIPILSSIDLESNVGSYNFITAIEVLEHVSDPLFELKRMRQLLKPGGVLFYTTGNVEKHRNKISSWSYAKIPDVHISFYGPKAMDRLLHMSGFFPTTKSYDSALGSIIKYKILKNLRFKKCHILIDLLPWLAISWFVDRRYGFSRMPIGVALDER